VGEGGREEGMGREKNAIRGIPGIQELVPICGRGGSRMAGGEAKKNIVTRCNVIQVLVPTHG